MAKTAKSKKSKPVSVHSRAARRASSPSINTDKSLKNVLPPPDSKSFLGIQSGAGVSKRKSKQLSRNKRLRREKGMHRAEAVIDQLEKKVETSNRRAKTMKERRHDWENVNEKAGDPVSSNARASGKQYEEKASSEMDDIEQSDISAAPFPNADEGEASAANNDVDEEDVVL